MNDECNGLNFRQQVVQSVCNMVQSYITREVGTEHHHKQHSLYIDYELRFKRQKDVMLDLESGLVLKGKFEVEALTTTLLYVYISIYRGYS